MFVSSRLYVDGGIVDGRGPGSIYLYRPQVTSRKDAATAAALLTRALLGRCGASPGALRRLRSGRRAMFARAGAYFLRGEGGRAHVARIVSLAQLACEQDERGRQVWWLAEEERCILRRRYLARRRCSMLAPHETRPLTAGSWLVRARRRRAGAAGDDQGLRAVRVILPLARRWAADLKKNRIGLMAIAADPGRSSSSSFARLRRRSLPPRCHASAAASPRRGGPC